MIFLLLAIGCSAAISIIMRISSGKVTSRLTMLATNYLVCSALGAFYTKLPAGEAVGLPLTVALAGVNGILLLVSFILLQLCTRKNGIVLSSVFMKLGLLVPTVMAVVFFSEIPSVPQILGFCLAIGAIVVINITKGEQRSSFGLVLILLLLLGGSADAMVNVFEELGPPALSGLFLLMSFAVAFVLCVVLVIIKKERPSGKALLFGALIGIPNFFSSKFLLGALSQLPAVVVYPTFCVATMLTVTLVGVLFFKERLTPHRWIAFGCIILALILLNI